MARLPTLTCPECGKVARTESALRHTRRAGAWPQPPAWLLAGAHILSNVPVIQSRGWWAVAPRPMLLLASGLFAAKAGTEGLPSNCHRAEFLHSVRG